MRNVMWMAIFGLGSALLAPAPAAACGGFFCSAAPIDQNAERIVFAVDDVAGTTDMIVQISYQGVDKDFAWLLPVGVVPQNRQVFPNGALGPLDAQTGPTFSLPANCARDEGDSDNSASGPPSLSGQDPSVTVLVQETVGPFDVAVIESGDPAKAYEWLTNNGFRLAPAMQPYIALYTAQGMKFLALKLTANATVKDIQPFRMTLPGTTPSIPLRLTAIAAEPEMGVVVWILGQKRYEPANALELTIPTSELRWSARSYPVRTNWTDVVARKVDEQGGRAWVVEQAGSTAQLQTLLMSSFANTPDQMAARDALVGLFNGRPYMTRLYTRVAAEEMTYDPLFRQSDKPDVPRDHLLPYDAAQCGAVAEPPIEPCDFAACGGLGLCSKAYDKSLNGAVVAACACAPGSTARTTFDPQGLPTVTCQDQRMSFINPGETDMSGVTFPDPCVGYSCGQYGRCVAMNLTPTCECQQGFVAIGGLMTDGQTRRTECAAPLNAVDKSFYNRRPPALAAGMTAGRVVEVAPVSNPSDVIMPGTYGEPMPALATQPAKENHGCSVGHGESTRGDQGARATLWLALSALAWRVVRRRSHLSARRRGRSSV